MPVIYSSTHNEIDNDGQIDLGVGNFVQAVVGHSLEFLLCADGAERAVIHNDQWCCGVRPDTAAGLGFAASAKHCPFVTSQWD